MTTGLRVVAKGRLTYRGEVSSTDLHGFICPRGVSCPTFPPCHCQHDFPLTVTRSSLSVRSFPRYTSSTLSCLRKGGNPDPRMWGARETIPNDTLSPSEVLAETQIPRGGGRGRLYPTIHSSCHHQRYWQKPRSREVAEEGDHTQRHCHHQKYWQKPGSREVGEEGDHTQRYTHHQNDSA